MEVLLEHHYGWKNYNFPKAATLEQAAYMAVRESHKFLTDDNHDYEIKESLVTISRNSKSPEPLFFSTSQFATFGWTKLWFSMLFKGKNDKEK